MPDVINPGPITTVQPPAIVVNTPMWLDKRLLAAILTPVLILLSKKLSVELNVGEIVGIAFSFISFIVMSSWKSKTLTQSAIEAGATAAAAPSVPGVVPPAQQ